MGDDAAACHGDRQALFLCLFAAYPPAIGNQLSARSNKNGCRVAYVLLGDSCLFHSSCPFSRSHRHGCRWMQPQQRSCSDVSACSFER
jgi:hypothetical protein